MFQKLLIKNVECAWKGKADGVINHQYLMLVFDREVHYHMRV